MRQSPRKPQREENLVSEAKYAGFLPGKHAIDAYGQGGFRFADMSHKGSILALPSGIRAWSVQTPEEIDLTTLAPVFQEPKGAIEHLLVGTGVALMPLPAALRQALLEAGIVAEPMTTGAAANTYSLLLREDRLVAAALLAVP
jgi:uncharacterized protein